MVNLPADELRRRALSLRLVLTDVDGVLTDAGVYYGEHGEVLKRFNVRDGMGVELLREAGVATAFLTRERSPSVQRRAEKLGIERAYLGVREKLAFVEELRASDGLAEAELAFIGDDVNDLPLLSALSAEGLTGAPADAHARVLEHAHCRCARPGGHGAFREFAEWLLALRSGGRTR